jgi:hypothetical protein
MTPEYRQHLSRLTLEDIQRTIDSVTRADLRTADIDVLKQQLNSLLWAYSAFAILVDGDRPIYRARRHSPAEKTLGTVDDIYPCVSFIKKLGRANREQQPIFYFSVDPVIALHECKASEGDVFSVLKCKADAGSQIALVPIGIHELFKKHGKKLGGNFPELAQRIIELFQNDEENLKKYELIDGFVRREFLKVVDPGNEHEFKLTVAIAEYLFEFETDIGRVDGIAYPSIASDWYNANIAFTPESFRHLYKAIGCKWQKIDGTKPAIGFSVSEVVATRVTADGRIEWPK